ncbi:MAG: hypothetical protein K2M06_08030 [Muribaculaceae bacterium]|nr:hypothetical protein [Muribaculaceae bacterium]
MKKILLLTLLALGALAASAADALRVKPAGGEPAHFHFDSMPELSFVGGKLHVKTSGAQPVEFDLENIEALDFVDLSGIEGAGAPGLHVYADADGVHFRGAAEGAMAAVYSISGQLLKAAACPAGEFDLSRAEYGRGIYIVKIDAFTTKVAL